MTSRVLSSVTLPFISSLLFLSGCANLAEIAEGQCGNMVTEPDYGEECDGETACFTPGTTFQCRHQCIEREDEDGEIERECAVEGYSCGLDNVCRAPSGEYEFVAEITGSPTLGLSQSDFDNDGRLDVLRESATRSFVQFYGDGFSVAASEDIVRIPNDVAPLLAPLNDDDLNDVGFAFKTSQSSGLVIYRTRSDGGLDPTIYSTIPVPADENRDMQAHSLVGNFANDPLHDEVIGFIGPYKGKAGQLVALTDASLLEIGTPDGFKVKALVGAAVGELDPALPCQEIAFAEDGVGEGSNNLFIARPCNPSGNWTTTPNITTLTLPAGNVFFNLDDRFYTVPTDPADEENLLAPIRMHSAVHIADVDGDTLQDIVAVALDLSTLTPEEPLPKASLFVALQQPGGVFPPELMRIRTNVDVTGECDVPNPKLGPVLAFGDFDGDGQVDVVTERTMSRLLNPTVVTPPMGPPELQVDVNVRECVSWGRAVVADFDGNDTLDIVATRIDADLFEGEALEGLDVRRGDGQGAFTKGSISTNRPVQLLEVGDFDGDFINDIVFAETDAVALDDPDASATDEVYAVFGRTFGGFDAPRSLGQVRLARHIAAGRFYDVDATDDIAVLSRPQRRQIAIAPIIGNDSRQLVAPFLFVVPNGNDPPVLTDILSVVQGKFHTDDAVNSFAVVTRDKASDNTDGPIRIWRVVSSGEQAELDVSALAAPDESELDCTDCVFSASDLDGDGLDELVAFGTRFQLDANFEADVSSAIVIFEVDVDNNSFERRGSPQDVTEDNLTFSPSHYDGPNNAPIALDFNGDGTVDIALLANTHNTFDEYDDIVGGFGFYIPSQMVVFWNDHSGSISTSRTTWLDQGTLEIISLTVVQNDTDPLPEIVVAVEEGFDFGEFEGPDEGEFPPDEETEPFPTYGYEDQVTSRVLDLDGEVLPFLEDAKPLIVRGDFAVIEPDAVVAGDFDGDGVEDLLTGDFLGYIVLRGVPLEP